MAYLDFTTVSALDYDANAVYDKIIPLAKAAWEEAGNGSPFNPDKDFILNLFKKGLLKVVYFYDFDDKLVEQTFVGYVLYSYNWHLFAHIFQCNVWSFYIKPEYRSPRVVQGAMRRFKDLIAVTGGKEIVISKPYRKRKGKMCDLTYRIEV